MLARGFNGELPKDIKITNDRKYWISALVIPLLALIVLLLTLQLGSSNA
jgi:hypothetical protein